MARRGWWCVLAVALVPAALLAAALLEAPHIVDFAAPADRPCAASVPSDSPTCQASSAGACGGGGDDDAFGAAFGAQSVGAAATEGVGEAPAEGGALFPSEGGLGSGRMFDRIAGVYDLLNRLISLGLDQSWRRELVENCLELRQGDVVLDLATGTGDVALLAAHRLLSLGAGGLVVALDPSPKMLAVAARKVRAHQLQQTVALVVGDAQNLSWPLQEIDLRPVEDISTHQDRQHRLLEEDRRQPHHHRPVEPPQRPVGHPDGQLRQPEALASLLLRFAGGDGLGDASVDKISIGFGIRNIPNRARAFEEMRRVLRKSSTSRVCVLEVGLPEGAGGLALIVRGFIAYAVPLLGYLGTLGSGEYGYLARSILGFPSSPAFAASMAQHGFTVHRATSFLWGAIRIYSAGLSGCGGGCGGCSRAAGGAGDPTPA